MGLLTGVWMGSGAANATSEHTLKIRLVSRKKKTI